MKNDWQHTFTTAALALLFTSTLIGCAHESKPQSSAITPLGEPGSGEPFLAHDQSSSAPARATTPEQAPTSPPTSPAPSPATR